MFKFMVYLISERDVTMKKTISIYIVGFMLFMIILLSFIFHNEAGTIDVSGITDFKRDPKSFSKAETVAEINRLIIQVNQLEKESGFSGKEGYLVYSPRITAQLFSIYQGLYFRLHYLNMGDTHVDSGQWEGYPFDKINVQSYSVNDVSVNDVSEVIEELSKNGVPRPLLNQFHIFLLPDSIPEISGLGGAGFAMISAVAEPLTDQLKVTLDHEIGHHIHLSFMPEDSMDGKINWNKYLTLRGGGWHGPGKVNTMDWNNSSEETFAEDFRMLFGKDQPYYGDITLGDPRVNLQQADNLKTFIRELGDGRTKEKYRSPWIPSGMGFDFWRAQGVLIPLIWIVIGFFGLVIQVKNTRR
jgi:hypothetical protein